MLTEYITFSTGLIAYNDTSYSDNWLLGQLQWWTLKILLNSMSKFNWTESQIRLPEANDAEVEIATEHWESATIPPHTALQWSAPYIVRETCYLSKYWFHDPFEYV